MSATESSEVYRLAVAVDKGMTVPAVCVGLTCDLAGTVDNIPSAVCATGSSENGGLSDLQPGLTWDQPLLFSKGGGVF